MELSPGRDQKEVTNDKGRITGEDKGGGDHAACLFISLAECPSNGYNYLFLHYRDTIGRQ